MDIVSTIVGFVGGILAKSAGDYVSFRMLQPCLHIEFKRTHLFIVPTNAGTYVRVRVTNKGRRTARNCKGFLLSIERRLSNGDWEGIEGGEDGLQLIWANATGAQRMNGFDIAPGLGRFLDVFTATTDPDWKPQAIPAEPTDDAPSILPIRLHPHLLTQQVIRLRIQVVAEDTEAAAIALVFEWKGSAAGLRVDEDPLLRYSSCE